MNDLGALYTRIEADTKGLNKAESHIKAFATRAAGYLAGIASVATMANLVKDVTLLAARYDTLGIVVNQVGKTAGYSTREMSEFQKGLERTGISAIASRETLAKMTQAQIDLSKSSELARIAQDAAVIGNINSSEAFQRMINGIQSAEVEILRGIGLNVNFENSYKEMAAQLGKNVDKLSQQEKTQARVNSVVKAGIPIQGVYASSMESAGKKLNSLPRYIENIKVLLGKFTQDGFSVAIDKATDSAKSLENRLSNFDVKFWSGAIGDATYVILNFETVLERVKNKIPKESFGGKLFQINTSVFENIRNGLPVIGSASTAISLLNKASENQNVSSFLDKAGSSFKRFYSQTKESFMSLDEIVKANLKDVLSKNYIDPWAQTALATAGIRAREVLNVKRDLNVIQGEYEKHRDAIFNINDQIKQNKLSGDQLIRELKREGMSKGSAEADLKKEAQEYVALMEKAKKTWEGLKNAKSKEDVAKKDAAFEDIMKYADTAQSKFLEMDRSSSTTKADVIKNIEGIIQAKDKALQASKQVEVSAADALIKESDFTVASQLFGAVKTQAEGLATITFPAMKKSFSEALSPEVIAQLTENIKFLNEQVAKGNATESQAQAIAELTKKIDEAFKEQLGKTKTFYEDVDKTIIEGSEKTTDGIIKNNGKVDESIKKIEGVWTNTWDQASKDADAALNKMLTKIDKVKSAAASIKISSGSSFTGLQSGGMIQRLREGGMAVWNKMNAIKASTGRFFSGFGGGDKIPILGEAGEYMINKYKVREAGPDTAAAFNAGNWGKVIQNLLPKLRTGGPMPSAFPRQALAYGGGVQNFDSGSSDSVRNYFINGSSEPISVRADNKNNDRLLSALQRKYRNRS